MCCKNENFLISHIKTINLLVEELMMIVTFHCSVSAVPNSLEGQITLSNAEFSPEYNDERSPVYKKLIKDLENEIKNALSQNGNEEFFVKIIGLK